MSERRKMPLEERVRIFGKRWSKWRRKHYNLRRERLKNVSQEQATK